MSLILYTSLNFRIPPQFNVFKKKQKSVGEMTELLTRSTNKMT